MDIPTAADLLGFDAGAGAVQRVVAGAPEPRGLLSVRLATAAADEVVLGAVDFEVLVAETLALGRDGHVALAGAQALGPRHVVVRAALADLVAEGDGAADDRREGRGGEYGDLGGDAGELHFEDGAV